MYRSRPNITVDDLAIYLLDPRRPLHPLQYLCIPVYDQHKKGVCSDAHKIQRASPDAVHKRLQN